MWRGRCRSRQSAVDVKADVYGRSAEIKSVSGDVVLRGRGRGAGFSDVHISTISGNIRVDRTGRRSGRRLPSVAI